MLSRQKSALSQNDLEAERVEPFAIVANVIVMTKVILVEPSFAIKMHRRITRAHFQEHCLCAASLSFAHAAIKQSPPMIAAALIRMDGEKKKFSLANDRAK